MNTYRKNAITAGVLLLLGFTGVVTMVTIAPMVGSPDYLTLFAANGNKALVGAFFSLIMAMACTSIAIALYPALKKYSEGLALGAVGFRIIEAMFQVVSVLSIILLLTLGQDFVKAGAPLASHFQTTGALLLKTNEWLGNVIILLPWSIGALIYHYIFFKTRLIPRWLAVWGLIGVPFTIAGCMLYMFGVIGSGTLTVLQFPLGLQEIPLALWLIVKGFNPKAFTALTPKQA